VFVPKSEALEPPRSEALVRCCPKAVGSNQLGGNVNRRFAA